jgi:hypothetical protein
MNKIIILAALVLTGCNTPENRQSDADDSKRVCIDGVSYIYMRNAYGSSVSPHLKPDGKPYTC